MTKTDLFYLSADKADYQVMRTFAFAREWGVSPSARVEIHATSQEFGLAYRRAWAGREHEYPRARP